MLKGVFVVLATLALARAADLSGEADASASAMDAQLAQLREEVSSLQSENEHLLADAKALGMNAAPAPLITVANTAELEAAAAEASTAELDAEIAAAVVDTSATESDSEAEAEAGAEDQAVDAEVDIYADGNAAATVSDDTNAVDESAAAVPQPSLTEVDAQQKVAALQGEEKAVDAEMAGLEGELQSLMDESDAVLLSNAQSDADEEVAAEEAAASGEDEAEDSEEEADEESTVESEEADVAESIDDAFAFRQLVESSTEGEEALLSAESSLPSEDRDETPAIDAAAEQEAETEELADAVADAEAELTEAADEDEAEDESEEESEAEAEAEEEVDEDAEVEAEVDVDAELEMNEQALDESLDADAATALVETQTAEAASVNVAALMEQEQSLHAQIEAERVEKADLDRQITQERYISAEAHRELAARISEINSIISARSAELGALERQRAAKEAALKKVNDELLAHTGKADAIKRANNKASRLQSSVVKQIQESLAAAKAAAAQKTTAQAAASAATTDAEKARVELAALRQQMAVAQRTLFRSRLSHSFGLVQPPNPKKLRKPEPKYGMYLREGEESGAEDSGQAFWRRVVARRTGKGFYEPYYERVAPAKKAKKNSKKRVCKVGKDGKKKCKRVVKPKKQYVRPEWAPEPPKKCKKGFLGKLCRLKKKLAKLTVDMSVVPEFLPEKTQPPVEYRDRVPKRDARIADLLQRIQRAEKALSMYGLHAATASQRFAQVHDEAEESEESEDEAEEEAEEEESEEAEDEAEEESEDESEESAEAEDESEAEAEEESESEAEAETEAEGEAEAEAESESESEENSNADAEALRFVQSLVTANAEMQARLQAAADATANTEAVTATEAEAHTEAAAETEAHTEVAAAAETEAHAEVDAEAEAHAAAEAEAALAAEAEAAAQTQGAVEAEAVQNLAAATKRWGANAVEAQEVTALDTLIAKMQNLRQKQSTRKMQRACVKGDAACLKKAQEADAEKLKKKMAKLTLKPTIVDIRRKLLLKRLALLHKIKKAQKKAEFVTPAYHPSAAADFVKPEYAGEKNKKIHLGLPSGWVIPKRLNTKRN